MNQDPVLDARIDASHRAAERQEADARKIIARLRMIPGTAELLKRRRNYGTYPNPWAAGQENLSVQLAITANDLSLAHYLSQQAGKGLMAADDDRIEAERAREESIARMQQATEQMRQRNQLVRQQHQHAATYGKQNPFTGQWV